MVGNGRPKAGFRAEVARAVVALYALPPPAPRRRSKRFVFCLYVALGASGVFFARRCQTSGRPPIRERDPRGGEGGGGAIWGVGFYTVIAAELDKLRQLFDDPDLRFGCAVCLRARAPTEVFIALPHEGSACARIDKEERTGYFRKMEEEPRQTWRDERLLPAGKRTGSSRALDD